MLKRVLAQRDGLTVVDDPALGYAHLDPLPAAADLERYYSAEFWQQDKAGWPARYESQRDWDIDRYTDWLTTARSYVPELSHESIVDVGCGFGGFLAAADGLGMKPFGIEPSVYAAAYAKRAGFTVADAPYEQVFISRGSCGFVSALWLLEHVVNPVSFLDIVRNWLMPSGILILAVPQEFTADQARANRTAGVKNWFVHKTHINYFTAASLGNLLGRCGFRVVDMLATWPIERFIVRGRDYTVSEALGDEIHAGIRERDMKKGQSERVEFYRGLARRGLGRDLIVFAQREQT